MVRRLLPVLSLWLLAPLVAEYLLGSLPVSLIGILPLMGAMYGSGALLIREAALRSGGGWTTIALLGAAYGFIEEGFVTQSLFNPNYLHLRLLDFGYIHALGTGLPWLVFVVTIHTVWSIAVPIGFADALFQDRRDRSWLGPVGIAVFVALFLAGAAAVAIFTYRSLPFMASPAQFLANGVVVALLIVAAFAWPRWRKPATDRTVPHPAVLFLLAFSAGSGVMSVEQFATPARGWLWQASLGILLAIEIAFVVLMIIFTRGRRWHEGQRFAVMAGGLGVYVVFGFVTDRQLHGSADLVPHAFLTACILGLLAIAAMGTVRSARPHAKPPKSHDDGQ